MSKKQPSKKAAKVDRTQYLLRCSVEESELFENISELDGHKSVQEWLLRLARLRARVVKAAEANGTLDQL